MQQYVKWSGINFDIKCTVKTCATCQCHCPLEPQQLLQPTQAPDHPLQHLGGTFFHAETDYLIVTDYYSRILIAHRIPTSQCNTAKTVSIMKELSAEHRISELQCTENVPQFVNICWVCNGLEMWSQQNLRSNGQAEAAMKIVKGPLTHAKCSGKEPYLALLGYYSTSSMHICAPLWIFYTSGHYTPWYNSVYCFTLSHNIALDILHLFISIYNVHVDCSHISSTLTYNI